MKTNLPGMFKRLRGSSPLRRVKLREGVAESSAPTLLRGGEGAGALSAEQTPVHTAPQLRQCPTCAGSAIVNGALCPRCNGAGTIPAGAAANSAAAAPIQESQQRVELRPLTAAPVTRLREATATGSPVFEVELIAEGFGNQRDRVFYTAQALREAASSGVFNNMQAYADHPNEKLDLPERSVRTLVGYYRNVRFVESGSKGKPAVKAELVVNQGQSVQWFVDLLESAIAARGDGVELCGISIDGGGLVETGDIGGQRVNICRQITEAPSADVVTRAAAGGTIVKRLRESEARTQFHQPEEARMKVKDLSPKLVTTHTTLREAVGKLTEKDASEKQIAAAIQTINGVTGDIEQLSTTEFEPEVKVEFREAEGGGDSAKLKADLENTQVKLREAETARDAAEGKVTKLEGEKATLTQMGLAAKVLRESQISTETAVGAKLFNELAKLETEEAMKTHIAGVSAEREELFASFRESLGVAPTGAVEGVPALPPLGQATAGGASALEEAGIPLLPEPSAA